LPPVAAEDANHNLNWDETIGSNDDDVTSSRPRPSLCSHAMAHGTTVCGIKSNNNNTKDWITWKTSFAPHQVCRVASNADGTIIVASTHGGTVSLLRGRDGKVLATRRVCSSSEGIQQQRPAEVAFVQDAQRHNKNKDVLIILVPPSDPLLTTSDATTTAASEQQQQHVVNVILVSNIDGERLNNDADVAEAAKNMAIDAVKLDTPVCKDFESLQGCFLNQTTIRFAAGQADGNVSIHDYNVQRKQSVLVSKGIEVGDDSSEQTFLTSLGMKLQHCGNDTTFLLLCGHADTHNKLYWYDLVHLNMACECILPVMPANTTKPPSLLAMEPVSSYDDNKTALAVAVAMKESPTALSGFLQVIQVYAEDTLGLAVLSHPHKVYQIPLESSTGSSRLDGIDLHALEQQQAGPYSFRFRANYGSQTTTCNDFVTINANLQDGLVGKIRLLLQRELYDEADELVAANDCNVLTCDPFAAFHSSEVALRKLQRLLSSSLATGSSQESMQERARDCLRRIIAGAVSSNETGQQHLVEAADSVLSWPSTVKSDQKPTIAEFSMALAAMVTAIQTALQSAHPAFGPQLANKKKQVEDRLEGMKCIQALVETDSTEIVLDAPFLEARSPSDVFLVLMEDGFFSLAQKFCRSQWGRHVTAEISASSILNLLPSQDPRAYAAVLKDSILPRLSITHEAIPLIRAWACQCANAYDDNDEGNELGLNASIFLLEVRTDWFQ
jgi:hypothetical protein